MADFAKSELPKTNELQALAYHLFTVCKDERTAFDSCMDKADKSSQCKSEYQALATCTKGLLSDALAKAQHEFKEYAHCLDLVDGKYSYCRPEKNKFESAFPLE